MLDRHSGYYNPVCDVCDARLGALESFSDAVRAMMAAGWETRKTAEGYEHICADCIFKEKGYDDEQTDSHH